MNTHSALSSARSIPLLELKGITKRFGGVTALDHVDFELWAGEIHALLGENGAGKSTLIKILAGIYHPDEGTVWIDGRPVTIAEVARADRLGIRVIHQELSLAPNLSIAENLFLGREPTRWGWLDRRAMEEQAAQWIVELGLDSIQDVRIRVRDLNVARRQMVEIARALSRQARILILDEPTSSLAEAETEALFTVLRRLRGQGVGIIYISHRLEEIIRLADRITVLRDGCSMGTQPVSNFDQKELIRWMVGREIIDRFHRPAWNPGAVALEVRNLRNPKIRDVSFELRYGEILGLAGLVGAGRTELARALFGIDPRDHGEILVDGRPVRVTHPTDALNAGIVLVPEERRQEGLVMIQSVAFNIALPWTADWNPSFRPDLRKRDAIVRRALDAFHIKATHPAQCVSDLSGGNQQKTLVGRWMEHRPKVLILDEPTRGVDVGSREEMFRIVGSLVEQGMAVLLISSDLVEVMNVAHRIALYRDGRILRIVDADRITPEDLMMELTGAREHEIA
ncbi:MAG: sugar ABC transporter ATP-binding protein [bacterium]